MERFNWILNEKWAYARSYLSKTERSQSLNGWLHRYKHHWFHTAISDPPASPTSRDRTSRTMGRKQPSILLSPN